MIVVHQSGNRLMAVAMLGLILVATPTLAMCQTTPHGRVLKTAGTNASPDESCVATLQTSEKGGYLTLTVTKVPAGSSQYNVASIDDVTGIGWFDSRRLIVSVGAIYGKPGLYQVDCQSKKVARLVAPNSLSPAYPDGADYFELYDLQQRKIQYYYGADIDNIDFLVFRRPEHLRTFELK